VGDQLVEGERHYVVADDAGPPFPVTPRTLEDDR
jgi:hypothetical protein